MTLALQQRQGRFYGFLSKSLVQNPSRSEDRDLALVLVGLEYFVGITHLCKRSGGNFQVKHVRLIDNETESFGNQLCRKSNRSRNSEFFDDVPSASISRFRYI